MLPNNVVGRSWLLIVVAAAALLGACSGGEDETFSAENGSEANDDFIACSEWESRDVELAEVEFGCDQGDNNIAGAAVHDCDDGRTLYWNDAGWGYVGEPMNVHAPGQELVAPANERTACGDA